ncbi:MAG: hypothetical protein LBB43_05845 [Spirochaetaceae bacterium]|nr:hypothetical protein [Spirochaetaceae bacterium]
MRLLAAVKSLPLMNNQDLVPSSSSNSINMITFYRKLRLGWDGGDISDQSRLSTARRCLMSIPQAVREVCPKGAAALETIRPSIQWKSLSETTWLKTLQRGLMGLGGDCVPDAIRNA